MEESKIMKKLITFSLCAIMTLSLSTAAFAAKEPVPASPGPALRTGHTLLIDGEDTGVRACVMVPLRAVAEKLGFEVVWDNRNTIFLDDGRMHAAVTLGKDLYQVTTSKEGMVGMSAPFSLGMAPYAVNGVTYVPLGLFDALLGSRQGAVTMTDEAICLDTDPLNRGGSMQIPNPFAAYETLADAARAAGFEAAVPAALNGSDHRVFRAVENDLLEVIYCKGGDETARIRKAAGTGDISGDYSAYTQVDTAMVNGIPVTLKGDSGKLYLAVWTSDGYAYSVCVKSGISSPDMTRLISGIR